MHATEQQLDVGAHVLANGLRQLGYLVDDSVPKALGTPPSYGFVRFNYTIKLGSRRGEIVPIGFAAPNDSRTLRAGSTYSATYDNSRAIVLFRTEG